MTNRVKVRRYLQGLTIESREFKTYKKEIERGEIKNNIEESKRRNQEWKNLTVEEKS